jgi:predicted DNA-binding transcriptional regulator AlpA
LASSAFTRFGPSNSVAIKSLVFFLNEKLGGINLACVLARYYEQKGRSMLNNASLAQDVFLVSRQVRARYCVSDMSLWRWLRDEGLGFPHPIRINERRFWRLSELEAWETSRAGDKAAYLQVSGKGSGLMARTTPTFRQVDVTRVLKAARAAGLEVGRVEIDAEGKIVLVAKSEACEPSSPLEKWKQDRARAS